VGAQGVEVQADFFASFAAGSGFERFAGVHSPTRYVPGVRVTTA
jgi:hypothetical protein